MKWIFFKNNYRWRIWKALKTSKNSSGSQWGRLHSIRWVYLVSANISLSAVIAVFLCFFTFLNTSLYFCFRYFICLSASFKASLLEHMAQILALVFDQWVKKPYYRRKTPLLIGRARFCRQHGHPCNKCSEPLRHLDRPLRYFYAQKYI